MLSPADPPPTAPFSLIRWFESTRQPAAALCAAAFLLYLPSLFGGFVLDDLRGLRCLEEYRSGHRDRLDLYRFLRGPEDNRQARAAGRYPWWLGDDVRYLHFRPLAERFLYAEYLLFGRWAAGYRVVALAIYLATVVAAWRLFTLLAGRDRTARWAALIFAVAAGHAVPVAFISAHCDVLALALAAVAALGTARFVAGLAGAGTLAWAAAGYAAGLFAKEAVLPAAVAPACWALVFGGSPGARRRGGFALAVLAAIAVAWLTLYTARGYGCNAEAMLDPLHAPGAYLAALPSRVVLMLGSWLVPLNPFLFWLNPRWTPWLPVYTAALALILAVTVVSYIRHHRREPVTRALALWAAAFLPLLACTTPDDRIMAIPSIGLAWLAAVWLTRPRPTDAEPTNPPAAPARRLRRLPLVLFLILPVAIVPMTTGLLQFMEREAQKHLRLALNSLDRPPRDGDRLYFLNLTRAYEALFTQDRLEWIGAPPNVRAMLLSDVADPKIEIIDPHTLRLTPRDQPLFASYLGRMATSRDRPKRPGDLFEVGDFTARLLGDGEQIQGVEIRFDRPLQADGSFFFRSHPNRPPDRVDPAALAPADRDE